MINQQNVHELRASAAQKYDQNNSRADRWQLSCRLSFTDDREFEWQGMLLHISIFGCRMFSAERLQEGKFLKVSICLPDQTDPLRIETAVVRWEQKGQVGLEFVSLQLEELDRLCAISLRAERGSYRGLALSETPKGRGSNMSDSCSNTLESDVEMLS